MKASKPQLYTPVFALLCLSQALFSGSFNMIIPELPQYLRSIGGEDYIGLIIGLFTVTAALSRPLSGKLTDTIGRMPVQILGTLVCVLASLMYPFATTIFGFLLIRFFHGFSTGFKPTATAAYLADIVPDKRRGEAMGILGVSMNIGVSISPPIGSFLANNYSLNVMFIASSGVALMSVLILIGMKETLQDKQKFSPSLLRIRKEDVFDKSALLPALLCLVLYMSLGALLTIGPDQAAFLGMHNKGLFFTSFTACSILSRLTAGRISDLFGRVKVLQISLICMVLSLSFFYFVNTPTLFLVATGCLGFSLGIASPSVFAWTIDRCDDASRGRALSTIYIALEISIGFGAVFSAWLYNNDGANFGATFLTFAAITSLGLFVIWGKKDNYELKAQS